MKVRCIVCIYIHHKTARMDTPGTETFLATRMFRAHCVNGKQKVAPTVLLTQPL